MIEIIDDLLNEIEDKITIIEDKIRELKIKNDN